MKKSPRRQPVANSKLSVGSASTDKSTTLTRKKVQKEYDISPKSLYRLEKRGLLKASRILRTCLYYRSDIEALIRAGMVTVEV